MSDVNCVLVRDSRFNVSDTANFACEKGAMSSNIQEYTAQSATNSSVSFAIQTPSLSTLIDRNITYHGKFVLKLSCENSSTTAGVSMLDYGRSDSLGPYPLNQMATTMQATINSNNFTINQQDVMTILSRFIDKDDTVKLNGLAPSMPDQYFGNLPEGINSHANAQGSITNADQNNTYIPRGSYRILGSSTTDAVTEGTFVAVPQVVSPGAGLTGFNQIYILVESREPLMLSPFLWNNPAHNPAIYGIQTLNFQFTLNPNMNMIWRHVDLPAFNSGDTFSCSLVSWKECKLQLQYLTPHASMQLPASNVVYYNEINKYQYNGERDLLPATRDLTTALHLIPTSASIKSGTVTLNNISDKYLLAVRPKLSKRTCKQPDRYFPIKKLNVTWDTRSGLLSTYKKDDLFRMTNKCGANFSWLEFDGVANSHVAYSVGPGSNLVGYGKDTATCGAFIAFSPVYDMTISEEYYTAGSIGNFNAQFEVEFDNYYEETFLAANYELVIVCVTAGVMVNQNGSTSKYIAILDREKVLEVSKSNEIYHGDDVERLIGGSFLNKAKGVVGSLLSKMKPYISKGVDIAQTAAPYVEKGAKALKAMGYGKKKNLEKFLEQ